MGEWNTGQFTLNPGQSATFTISWGNSDKGPVYMEPREFSGSTRGNVLRVYSYGTIRGSDGEMVYFINYINDGPQVATFEIVGVDF